MFFFLDDLFGSGKIIFYVVSSWLLFLIVILIKGLIKGDFKKEKDE
ncbi:MAG TPA: hypothetical protein VK125_05205 [Bacillota bacterium]|nr:hypothetical protein [Bacillota bacterium]